MDCAACGQWHFLQDIAAVHLFMKYVMLPFRHVRNALILLVILFSLTFMMLIASSWLALRFFLMARKSRTSYIRNAITVSYHRYFAALHFLHIFRFDLTALDKLRGEKGLILTANHPALMDALLIISRLPNVVCVMKAQVLRNVMFGAGAKMAGYISNESIRNIIKESTRELQAGSLLLLFPEGTRSGNNKIQPFQGTVGAIARRTGCPVQSIFIEIDTEFLGKGWRPWHIPQFPINIRIRVGKRFIAKDDSKKFILELEKYYRRELKCPTISNDAERDSAWATLSYLSK